MEQTENDLDLGLWTTARTLWIKYCGIADEYKMMRDRWLYLHGENKLMVLPYLRRDNNGEQKKTFDLLDDLTKDLEGEFESIGFKRSEMENLSNFEKYLNSPTDNLINRLKLIEVYFYDLSNFVGLLKSAFFQRTVSTEIQHVVSGLPHSPERTIGNELLYLAADTVARGYCVCLNIPYGKWDGFITFIPPIEDYFYGGFYKPSPYLELFHISMSEEEKYFVGSYFTLAHEFGHAVMSLRFKRDREALVLEAPWMHHLIYLIYRYTEEFIIDRQNYKCERCPIYINLTNKNKIYEIIVELIADIIAMGVGGINTVHSFIDLFYIRVSDPKNQISLLLRILSCLYYLKLKDFTSPYLKKRITNIIEDAERIREKYGYYCPRGADFSECINGICARWAKKVNEFNMNFGKIFFESLKEDFGELLYQYNPFWGSIEPSELSTEKIFTSIFPKKHSDISINKKTQLFSIILKEGSKFKICNEEESEIKNALKEGILIPEKDPRHILHCYYEAYKESSGEERPNYTATIYSLAFNTYDRNKSHRE